MQLTSIKCIHAPRGIWPNLATVLLGTYIYIYSFLKKNCCILIDLPRLFGWNRSMIPVEPIFEAPLLEGRMTYCLPPPG